jgi:hypothetical protein
VFEAESEDLTIHCASCSQPVTLKKAMVHFERCFNKVGKCHQGGKGGGAWDCGDEVGRKGM